MNYTETAISTSMFEKYLREYIFEKIYKKYKYKI